jgi:hypothetical protein
VRLLIHFFSTIATSLNLMLPLLMLPTGTQRRLWRALLRTSYECPHLAYHVCFVAQK